MYDCTSSCALRRDVPFAIFLVHDEAAAAFLRSCVMNQFSIERAVRVGATLREPQRCRGWLFQLPERHQPQTATRCHQRCSERESFLLADRFAALLKVGMLEGNVASLRLPALEYTSYPFLLNGKINYSPIFVFSLFCFQIPYI